MSDTSRRDLVLKVADQLFRHYGPQKTTMADVAREANVGVGSVYLEFPSKDALIEELSRHHYASVLEAMRLASESASLEASDRLVRVLEARAVAFKGLSDGGTHACDLLHCGSSAVKAAQGAYHEQERTLIADILEDGRRTGELDVADIELTARVVLLAYATFAPPAIFKMDERALGAQITVMHSVILNGLVSRSDRKR